MSDQEIVKIVVPTHKRAGRVTTLRVIANAHLCVAASEEATYRAAYPNAKFIIHPDTVVGYAPKIQWIRQTVKNVFILDDDVDIFYRLYKKKGRAEPERPCYVRDPQRAYDIVQSTAFTAREMGAYLFGFSRMCHPLCYDDKKPFKFKGYVNGAACGHLEGSKLFIDEKFTVASDYWLCLLNAYHHRYLFIDTRFSFASDEGRTFQNTGGLAAFRNSKVEEVCVKRLVTMFGDAIAPKGKSSLRDAKTTFERVINLPY